MKINCDYNDHCSNCMKSSISQNVCCCSDLDIRKDKLLSCQFNDMNETYEFSNNTRKHKLSKKSRVLLVLMRLYPKDSEVAKKFHVSCSTVTREVDYILPILYSKLNFVSFESFNFKTGIIGAVDGTCHFRNRRHPKCYDHFRGDKYGFFINSQIATTLKGDLLNLCFAKGHNNDMGVFNMSKLKQFLIQNNWKMFGDGGYHHYLLLTPNLSKSKSK